MSFKKPFKAVPLEPRPKRFNASKIASFSRVVPRKPRGIQLPLGLAVAAGLGLGWALSGEETQPVAPQSFVSQDTGDRLESLRQREAAEPPETLSATVGTGSNAGDYPAPATRATTGTAFYRTCADARQAGAAPLYRGQPGYRDALDRDGDGVACEPYRGR